MTKSFFSSFDPEYRQKQMREKARLRTDASYIGALSITLTFVMQYAFSFIVRIMVACGALSADSVKLPSLGMDNTSFLLLYSFVYTVSLLLPALLVSFCYKKRFCPFAPARPVSFGFVFWAILSAVGMCMLTNIINSYISDFFREVGASVPDAPQLMVKTPLSFALNLFTIAVLPALIEEMVYRGYILRTLRAYGDGFAVVISALLFGLMHGNLRQIPFAFIVGLFLGFLYVLTNNIWVPIAVHFINNGISVAMEYFSFWLPEQSVGLLYALVIYGLITVGLLAMLVLLIGYRKKLRLSQNNSSLGVVARTGALFTTPLFVTAVLLYLIFLFMGM